MQSWKTEQRMFEVSQNENKSLDKFQRVIVQSYETSTVAALFIILLHSEVTEQSVCTVVHPLILLEASEHVFFIAHHIRHADGLEMTVCTSQASCPCCALKRRPKVRGRADRGRGRLSPVTAAAARTVWDSSPTSDLELPENKSGNIGLCLDLMCVFCYSNTQRKAQWSWWCYFWNTQWTPLVSH